MNIARIQIVLFFSMLGGCLDFPVPVAVGGACESNDECSSDLCHFGVCLTKNGDDDGDGLSNFTEWTVGSDPTRGDTDRDNISDANEVMRGGQTYPDRDKDGIPDILEHNSDDSDGDCLPDWADPAGASIAPSQEELRSYHCFQQGLCAEHEDKISVTCENGIATCLYSGIPGYAGPDEQRCDGIDENCDGKIDNGFVNSSAVPGDVCEGEGSCSAGILECSSDQSRALCSTERGGSQDEALDEICDGFDNDCDGQTDEGFSLEGVPVGAECQATGACGIGPGTIVCSPDMAKPFCLSSTGPVYWIGPEVCDGIDTDCNGKVDDNMISDLFSSPTATVGETCGLGDCQGGVIVCSPGGVPTCTTNNLSQEESCDGKDNDCDGIIDNDQSFLGAGLGTSCLGLGACGAGTVECDFDTGIAICSTNPGGSQAEDTPEVCDGVDNDCDGFVDDGLGMSADGFSSCLTPGVCGTGSFICSEDGDVVCSTAPGEIDSLAGPEACNGLDDDCDGVTDEETLGPVTGEWSLTWSFTTEAPGLLRASGGGEHFFFAISPLQEFEGPQIMEVNLDEGTSTLIPLPPGTQGLPAELIWDPLRAQLFFIENGLGGSPGNVHVLDEDGLAWANWNTSPPPLSAISCVVLVESGILMVTPEGAFLLELDEREWSIVTLPEGIDPTHTMSCEGGITSDSLTLRQRPDGSSSVLIYCELEEDPTTVTCEGSMPVSDNEQGWFDSHANQTFLVDTAEGRMMDWGSGIESTFDKKPFSTVILGSWWEATRSVGHLITWDEGTIGLFIMERSCPDP